MTTSLSSRLDNVRCGPLTFTTADEWSGSAGVWGPDLVDVADISRKIGGSLQIDLELVTEGKFVTGEEPSTREQAVRAAVTLTLAHHLHEIAEWLAIDGVAVFDTHVSEGNEWHVIARAAAAAAAVFCDDHPRPADGQTRAVPAVES